MDKNLNPRLNTEHRRIFDRQSEPIGQRLILYIDRDSLAAIQDPHRTFPGNCQGPERFRSTKRNCARCVLQKVGL
jgi:hypothetical protein